MTKKPLPSYEMLCKLLRYEPETGKLFWRERGREMFPCNWSYKVWNSRYAGKEAFTALNSRGYYHGSLFDTRYLAHRIIWILQKGCVPSEEIDHIDRNPANNRWENLRAATRSGNMSNVSSRKKSSSKYLGVSWHTGTKKWLTQIAKNGCNQYIGVFDLEDEAALAYDAKAVETHGVFANLNFPERLCSASDSC